MTDDLEVFRKSEAAPLNLPEVYTRDGKKYIIDEGVEVEVAEGFLAVMDSLRGVVGELGEMAGAVVPMQAGGTGVPLTMQIRTFARAITEGMYQENIRVREATSGRTDLGLPSWASMSEQERRVMMAGVRALIDEGYSIVPQVG